DNVIIDEVPMTLSWQCGEKAPSPVTGVHDPLACAPRRNARRNCVGRGCARGRGLGGSRPRCHRTPERTSHVTQLSRARDRIVANDHPLSWNASKEAQ